MRCGPECNQERVENECTPLFALRRILAPDTHDCEEGSDRDEEGHEAADDHENLFSPVVTNRRDSCLSFSMPPVDTNHLRDRQAAHDQEDIYPH